MSVSFVTTVDGSHLAPGTDTHNCVFPAWGGLFLTSTITWVVYSFNGENTKALRNYKQSFPFHLHMNIKCYLFLQNGSVPACSNGKKAARLGNAVSDGEIEDLFTCLLHADCRSITGEIPGELVAARPGTLPHASDLAASSSGPAGDVPNTSGELGRSWRAGSLAQQFRSRSSHPEVLTRRSTHKLAPKIYAVSIAIPPTTTVSILDKQQI
jgi:hypothetical protein